MIGVEVINERRCGAGFHPSDHVTNRCSVVERTRSPPWYRAGALLALLYKGLSLAEHRRAAEGRLDI